jgi:hypothetical protein
MDDGTVIISAVVLPIYATYQIVLLIGSHAHHDNIENSKIYPAGFNNTVLHFHCLSYLFSLID